MSERSESPETSIGSADIEPSIDSRQIRVRLWLAFVFRFSVIIVLFLVCITALINCVVCSLGRNGCC